MTTAVLGRVLTRGLPPAAAQESPGGLTVVDAIVLPLDARADRALGAGTRVMAPSVGRDVVGDLDGAAALAAPAVRSVRHLQRDASPSPGAGAPVFARGGAASRGVPDASSRSEVP